MAGPVTYVAAVPDELPPLPPRVTVSDPRRRLVPAADVVGDDGKRDEQLPALSKAVRVGLALIIVVAATTSYVGHRHSDQVRRAADRRAASAVDLVAELQGTGAVSDTGRSTFTMDVRVSDQQGHAFELLSAALDVRPWTLRTRPLRPGRDIILEFSMRPTCSEVAGLDPPSAVLVTVRRASGDSRRLRLPLDGSGVLREAERRCGFAPVEESLVADVGGVRRVGRTVVVDVRLTNGSRTPARLAGMGVSGFRVRVTGQLPRVLPPRSDTGTTTPVDVHAVATLGGCLGPGQPVDTSLAFVLVDADGAESRPSQSDSRFDDVAGALLAALC